MFTCDCGLVKKTNSIHLGGQISNITGHKCPIIESLIGELVNQSISIYPPEIKRFPVNQDHRDLFPVEVGQLWVVGDPEHAKTLTKCLADLGDDLNRLLTQMAIGLAHHCDAR